MSSFEDHFSKQASEYAHYRPQYPDELFHYLASVSPSGQFAWDCGTGNGQAAQELVKHFDHVIATDASSEQIAQAIPHERIEYRVERAEEVSLAPNSVDLITVAIAVHWFDLDTFYQVVRRVSKPDGIIAVWTYHLPMVDPQVDQVLDHYYRNVLAGYWPERIHYLEERYRTLPFPFEEIKPPEFVIRADWELDQLAGFLDSWSATQRYLKESGQNPLNIIWPELSALWGDPSQQRTIQWPLHLRVGRVNSNTYA